MGASSPVWVMALSSPMWIVGCVSLKSDVGLISLWISQVHCGSLKSGGVGWVLNQCGLWWVVVALGLRIVVDRCVDRSGGGVEISLLFLGDYVVAISYGCGYCWWFF